MIRINLLPVPEKPAGAGRRRDLIVFILGLGLSLAVLTSFHLTQSSRLSRLQEELTQIQSQIQRLNTKTRGLADLRKKIPSLREKLRVIRELSRRKTGPARVMESLAVVVPPTLWLTDFKESNGDLTLMGLALDNQSIAKFLKELGSVPHFHQIDLVEATQVEKEERELKRFVMKSKLFYQLSRSGNGVRGNQSSGSRR